MAAGMRLPSAPCGLITASFSLGVAHAAATSDGELFDIPDTPHLDKKITHLQKRMAKSRCVAEREGRNFWDSKRYQDTKRRCAKAQSARAATKNDAVHAFTKRIAETYGVVVLEALKTEKMSRKRRGKGAASKRRLNRGIRDSRWGTILNQLQYKTGSSSRRDEQEPWVFVVDPRHTSQRCAKCGHIASENRESQAVFRCTECGHTDNADVNAAVNIVARHVEGWASPPWSMGKTGSASVDPAPALKRKPPALSVS